MGLVSGGAYAEYVPALKDHLIAVPSNLSDIEAASMPEVWLTAYQLLTKVLDVEKDS